MIRTILTGLKAILVPFKFSCSWYGKTLEISLVDGCLDLYFPGCKNLVNIQMKTILKIFNEVFSCLLCETGLWERISWYLALSKFIHCSPFLKDPDSLNFIYMILPTSCNVLCLHVISYQDLMHLFRVRPSESSWFQGDLLEQETGNED